jgi:hypothetical protein
MRRALLAALLVWLGCFAQAEAGSNGVMSQSLSSTGTSMGGVSSVSGDGNLIVNSGSTGAVTLALGSTANLTLNSLTVTTSTTLGSLTTGAVTVNGTGLVSSGTLGYAYGGTGAVSFTANGVVLAGASSLSSTTTLANAALVSSSTGIASWSQTLPSAVQLNITSLGAVTTGTLNISGNNILSGTTTINNALVTTLTVGTCHGCGTSATPGGSQNAVQSYSTSSTFGGSSSGNGLYVSTTNPTGLAFLYNVTTGFEVALPDNGVDTTGIAVGPGALIAQTSTGNDNSAGGLNSLKALTTGTNNTAWGANTLKSAVTDGYSTAVGSGALQNQAIGTTTSSTGNTAIGAGALSTNTTGGAMTAVGNNALWQATGTLTNGDTAIGVRAGEGVTTGANDTFGGYRSGGGAESTVPVSTMGGITLYGYFSDYGTSGSGGDATGIGYEVVAGNQTASIGALIDTGPSGNAATQSVFAGYNVCDSCTGSFLTMIGQGVAHGTLTTGTADVIVAGNGETTALSNTSSFTGIGIGVQGGTGDFAGGYYALHATTTNNNDNVGVGLNALGADTTGANNVGVGANAGDTGTNNCTTCNEVSLFGSGTYLNSTTTINATALGYGAETQGSNTIALGNTSITAIYAEVTSITGYSDRRKKKDIEILDPELGLDFVMKLKPVTFDKRNGDETLRMGFIAQDTIAALPDKYADMIEDGTRKFDLVDKDDDGYYRMNYVSLMAPVVSAIQTVQTEVNGITLENDPCGSFNWLGRKLFCKTQP